MQHIGRGLDALVTGNSQRQRRVKTEISSPEKVSMTVKVHDQRDLSSFSRISAVFTTSENALIVHR
jgi:hypothetical protein